MSSLSPLHRITAVAAALTLLAAACTQATPTSSPTPAMSPTAIPTSVESAAPSGDAGPSRAAEAAIRDCAYRPGASVATMPREVREEFPTPAPSFEDPEPAVVAASVTAEQIEVLDSLELIVEENYHDPNLNGRDWDGIVATYRELFRAGVAEEHTSALLNQMLFQLDEHSQVESPEEIAEAEAAYEATLDYVGIGVLIQPLPESGGVILSVFAGSPAEGAGLLPHDKILEVNGEPLVFDDVLPNPILGEPDTEVTLVVERPGEETRELTLTRKPISGGVPITACIVPETTLGYIGIPCFCDVTLGQQVEEALAAMEEAGGITGLVLDNRINGGGHSEPLRDLLGFFLDGEVGAFVGPDGERPLEIDGEDIGGSQEVPLVVLVGQGTGSFGEVASGVLQVVDGATVIGSTSPGNVEILTGYELAHGWRAWIAHETFAPAVETYGPWEETGIVPDVAVPTRWDLFSEANDPALAEAVELLLGGG